MSRKKATAKIFQFRPGFTIGALSAEHDRFLEQCFVSNSCYEAILNIDDPRCGIIGRAGSGKTAILFELRKRIDDVIDINPEMLAFQFLGSSELIRALRSSNVTLDFFYKLLWRHVFVVEILKHFFPEESRRYNLIYQIIEHLKRTVKPDSERDRAIQYLDDWGGTILQAPQERIKNIHDTLAQRLRAKLGMIGSWSDLFGLGAGLEGQIESKKEITENIRIAKQEINQIQVQDLNAVKHFLDREIINDRQQPCYVLIDDLDRFWVEDPLVYELIRALILEIYDWSDVANIKIIYVLRDNILSKVESEFTSRSYQREKLEDQRVHLKWTRQELTEIVNRRLIFASNEMGVSKSPILDDILPKKSSNKPSGKDYIFDRILDRPRDIIDYINKTAELSVWKTSLSLKTIIDSEYSYSTGRLNSLFDEWRENCPGLEILFNLLRGGPSRFHLDWWSHDDFLTVSTDPKLPASGWLSDLCREYSKQYSENEYAALSFCRKAALKIFYEIGVVGIRPAPSGYIRYAHTNLPTLSDTDVDMNPEIIVHPAFHRSLDIA